VVSPHPVRLVVEDDLRRSRVTVLFRLILAIPHFVWAVIWSLLMIFVALANWVATLVAGRSPDALHNLIAAYLKYMTQLLAYLLLAADPYPPFVAGDRYPLRLEVGPPARQRRLVTLFRIVLALPALAFFWAFLGVFFTGHAESEGEMGRTGLLLSVVFFAWFAILVIARMPEGFRNLQAYGLRYAAQTWAYLFTITDRYPDLNPSDPPSSGPLHPVGLIVSGDLRRSRLTVFFRLLLALPLIVWWFLWWIAAFFAWIGMWFATVFSVDPENVRYGRSPLALHRFLSAFVRYTYHLQAFVSLAANPFPGFTGASGAYPIDPELPARERQHRLVVFFRLWLAFPAFAVSGGLFALLLLAAFFGWFVALILGRMPESFRDAQAYALRYGVQTTAYASLLTDRYPYSGPSLGQPEPEPEPELAPAELPA
jgi:Domain of unknown function (DUF4389)